jgi:hypothetical protein
VAEGAIEGVLVGIEADVDSTMEVGVALEQAVINAKMMGMIFFMVDMKFVGLVLQLRQQAG